MIRPATTSDLPRIEAFLTAHIATAMFPLSNLHRYGVETDHPRSMRFWVLEMAGEITGVLSVTKEGMIFPQLAEGTAQNAAAYLEGETAIGVIGAASQVADFCAVIDNRIEMSLNAVEAHFALHLADLQIPTCADAELVPLGDADYDQMLDWRTAYDVEALNADPVAAREIASRNMDEYLKQDSHRVLMIDSEPVCTTGFNATVPTCVQVGGVYTPPELRGRGFARLAVALHLEDARNAGATEAILFASSTAAAKAYMAIGFRQIGEFTLMLFKEPTVIHV